MTQINQVFLIGLFLARSDAFPLADEVLWGKRHVHEVPVLDFTTKIYMQKNLKQIKTQLRETK
jgi:hypothetical protein